MGKKLRTFYSLVRKPLMGIFTLSLVLQLFPLQGMAYAAEQVQGSLGIEQQEQVDADVPSPTEEAPAPAPEPAPASEPEPAPTPAPGPEQGEPIVEPTQDEATVPADEETAVTDPTDDETEGQDEDHTKQ